MKYLQGTDFYTENDSVITLGKFDGLHKGHELLFEDLLRRKKEGFDTIVFTFEIPPKPGIDLSDYKVLTTNKEKADLLENMGIDVLISCPFTKEIRDMDAKSFVKMIVGRLHIKHMVVGNDFCFGHNRLGNVKLLEELQQEFGYTLHVYKKKQDGTRDISSTYVREEIYAGNIEKANELLGFFYSIEGLVVSGNQIGRTIGFPTMNIIPERHKLLPKFGVYVTRAIVDGKAYKSVTNIGNKPTVNSGKEITVETHILDENIHTYGKHVKVEFLHFIRPEVKFNSVEELKCQIQRDKETATDYKNNIL